MTEMQNETIMPSLETYRKIVDIENIRDAQKAQKKAKRLAKEARYEQLRENINRMTATPGNSLTEEI